MSELPLPNHENPALEPSEQMSDRVGDGDGCTISYYHGLRGPIVPGSVIVRAISNDAVSSLGRLTDPLACEMAAHDISKDGVLYGKISSGTIDYMTGAINVTWDTAPMIGYKIEVIWRRYVHKKRGYMIKIIDPETNAEEIISLKKIGEIMGYF